MEHNFSGPSYTIGIEEELMICDGSSYDLANAIESLLGPAPAGHVKPELNRGMWADDASHAIDWLLWTLGEPKSVSAQIATLRDPKVPDEKMMLAPDHLTPEGVIKLSLGRKRHVLLKPT